MDQPRHTETPRIFKARTVNAAIASVTFACWAAGVSAFAGLISSTEPPAQPAASLPTPAPAAPNADFDRRLAEIDALAGRIKDVGAAFVQVKHSTLLTEPLTSKGEVLSKGGVTLWSTTEPEATRVRTDASTMRVYYVKSNVVEEYPMEHGLASLASSPLPRLDTLRAMFSLEPDPGDGLAPLERAEKSLGVRLVPNSAELRKHVASVRVLLDAARAIVLVFEVTDPDGERTTIRFSDIRVDQGLSDERLDLRTAADARVVKPFDAGRAR